MRSRFIKSCIETIHISWHISAVCTGVLVGVSLLRALPYELFSGWPWLIGGVSLFLVASIKRARALLAASLLAGCCVGMWRGGIDQRALLGYAPYYGRAVQLSGQVREDASIGKHGEWQLQISGIQLEGRSLSGKVWASVSAGVSVKRGDTVFLKGVLDQGFGSMAASMHRAQLARVERPYPGDVARRIRDWFADGVRQGVTEPQASLGIGFLTGQHSALPAAVDEQLRVAGLTHIVVASGYNLTVLVGFARRVFAGVSKYLSTLSSVFMIGSFMMVAGLSASMSRAGLVAGLSLAAWYWGRTIHPLVLLPFAACITVLADPMFIWGDIGWYLSFLAFAGVVVVAPLLRSYFWPKESKTGALKQILSDTFAAQLVTLPLLLFVFGQFSSYALLANILVLPFVPLAMLLTFLAGIAGLMGPGLATVVGWPAQFLLSYMTRVVEWIAGLPGSSEEISLSLLACVGGYVVLAGLCVYLKHASKHDFRG